MSTADALARSSTSHSRHASTNSPDQGSIPAHQHHHHHHHPQQQHRPSSLPPRDLPRSKVALASSLAQEQASFSSAHRRAGPPAYCQGPYNVGPPGVLMSTRASYPSTGRTNVACRDQTISEDGGGGSGSGAETATTAEPRRDDGTASTSAGGAMPADLFQPVRLMPTFRVLKTATTPNVMAEEGQEWSSNEVAAAAATISRPHERPTATRPASGLAVGEITAASAADTGSAPYAGRHEQPQSEPGCQSREHQGGPHTPHNSNDTASPSAATAIAVVSSSPPPPPLVHSSSSTASSITTPRSTHEKTRASSPPLPAKSSFGGSGRMLPPIQIDWRTRSPQNQTEIFPSIKEPSTRNKEMDSAIRGRPLLLSRDDIINNRTTMHVGNRTAGESKRGLRGSSVSPLSDPGLRRRDADATTRHEDYESYDELSHTDSAGSHGNKRKHVEEARDDELERASNASSLGSGTSYCSSQGKPSVHTAVGDPERSSPRPRLHNADDRQISASKRGGDAGRGESSTNLMVQAPSNLRHPSSSTITFLATAPQRKSCDRCFKMKTKCSRAAPGASGDGPCEGCVRRGFGHDCVTSRPDFPHPRITLAKRQRREQSVPTSTTMPNQHLMTQRSDSPRMRPAHLSMSYNEAIASRHVVPQSRASGLQAHSHLQRESHTSQSPRQPPRHEPGATKGASGMYQTSSTSLYTSVRPGEPMQFERVQHGQAAATEGSQRNAAAHYHTVIRPRPRDVSYEAYRQGEHTRHSSESFYPGGHGRSTFYDPVYLDEAGHERAEAERHAQHAQLLEAARFSSHEHLGSAQTSTNDRSIQASSLTKLGTRELRDLCISATHEIVQRAVISEHAVVKRDPRIPSDSASAAAQSIQTSSIALPRAISALAVEHFETVIGPFLGKELLSYTVGSLDVAKDSDSSLGRLVTAIGLQVQGTLLNCPSRVPSKLAEGRVFKAYVESSQNDKSNETAFKVETVKSWLSGEQHLAKAVEIVKEVQSLSRQEREGMSGVVCSFLQALFYSLRGDVSVALDFSSRSMRRISIMQATQMVMQGEQESGRSHSDSSSILRELGIRAKYLDTNLASPLDAAADKGTDEMSATLQLLSHPAQEQKPDISSMIATLVAQCPEHLEKALLSLVDASPDDSGFASADMDSIDAHRSEGSRHRTLAKESESVAVQSAQSLLPMLDTALFALERQRSLLQSSVQAAVSKDARNDEQDHSSLPIERLMLSLLAASETLRLAHDALEGASLACAYVNLCAVRLNAVAWHFAMTSLALASAGISASSQQDDILGTMRKGGESLNTLVALLEAAEEREGWPFAQSIRWAQKAVTASTRKMVAMQEDGGSKSNDEAVNQAKVGDESAKATLDVHMAAVSSTLADNSSPLAALSTLASSTPPLQTMTQRLDRKQQWLVSAVRQCMQPGSSDVSSVASKDAWLAHLLRGNPYAAQKLEQACEREMAAVVKAEHSTTRAAAQRSSSDPISGDVSAMTEATDARTAEASST